MRVTERTGGRRQERGFGALKAAPGGFLLSSRLRERERSAERNSRESGSGTSGADERSMLARGRFLELGPVTTRAS